MHIVSVEIDGSAEAFEINVGQGTWHCDSARAEAADFPIVTEHEGARYEFYHDGTFSEQELS